MSARKFIQGAFLALFCGVVPAFAQPPEVASQVVQKAEVTTISLERLLPLFSAKRVLLIDARPSFALNFGKIRGADNWPASDRRSESVWKAKRAMLETARREKRLIVVYCTDTDCHNSRALAEVLAERGFACCVFEGGIHAWKEADLPTE